MLVNVSGGQTDGFVSDGGTTGYPPNDCMRHFGSSYGSKLPDGKPDLTGSNSINACKRSHRRTRRRQDRIQLRGNVGATIPYAVLDTRGTYITFRDRRLADVDRMTFARLGPDFLRKDHLIGTMPLPWSRCVFRDPLCTRFELSFLNLLSDGAPAPRG